MRKPALSILAALLAVLLGAPLLSVQASVPASEADHLGKDLTAAGAERAANKEGTIPTFEGIDKPPAGWEWGKPRHLFSRLKDEKPEFVIDASNVDKYADKLSPTQIYALKNIKGYTMPVYKTHRNCGMPPLIEERSKINALEAKLAPNGYGLLHAKTAGVPFPIPKNGAEVMWNYKLRVAGVGMFYQKGGSVISPRPGTNEFVNYDWQLYNYFPGGTRQNKNVEDFGTEFYQYYAYSAPPALAGQALLGINYLNKEPEAYYYFPGQRRVRRMPTYQNDTPLIGFENQYTTDQEMFVWSDLSRFDYKLVGKREMYIPYNTFRMFDFTAKRSDIWLKDFANPDFRRYELHRVWVVEATVKSGMRHIFPKRMFYADEDSWLITLGDEFDANLKPWKLREAMEAPIWELDGVCSVSGFVQYDMQGGRYLADYFSITQGVDERWYWESNAPQFKPDFYTPETLRSIMER